MAKRGSAWPDSTPQASQVLARPGRASQGLAPPGHAGVAHRRLVRGRAAAQDAAPQARGACDGGHQTPVQKR